MQVSVLATTCWNVPLIDKRVCTGLPNPSSTLVARPTFFGLSLDSTKAFAWFSIGILVVSVLMVRVWRDRGIARRLVAVRDNEHTAAALRHPGGADQAAGLRALGIHGRLCRRVPGLCQSAVQHNHLQPRRVHPGRLHGGDRRAWFDPRRRARRRLPGGTAGHLRHHLDHPVPHQRLRPARLPALPARWAGRGHAPPGRRDHRRCALAARPPLGPFGSPRCPAPARGASTGTWRRWPSPPSPHPRPGSRGW